MICASQIGACCTGSLRTANGRDILSLRIRFDSSLAKFRIEFKSRLLKLLEYWCVSSVISLDGESGRFVLICSLCTFSFSLNVQIIIFYYYLVHKVNPLVPTSTISGTKLY